MALKVSIPMVRTRSSAIETQSPYVVRGHHLELLAKLVSGQHSPRSLARQQRRLFERERAGYAWHPSGFVRQLAYIRDVIGNSRAEALQRERAQRHQFRRFLKLPDEHPFELVQLTPDENCSTCIIGSHCRQKIDMETGRPGTWDGIYAHHFQKVATHIGQAAALSIEMRTAEFTDAPPEQVECILTTCGIARAVLGAPDVAWTRKPLIYS